MNELKINNLHMLTQVLKQYRELTLNSNKFFYYSYGKLDVKLQSVLKVSGQSYQEIEFTTCSLIVKVDFEELKKLFDCNRIQKRDLNNIVKNIKSNSSISLECDGKTDIVFIYDRISIDSKEKVIEIEFNDHAIELFSAIRELPFSNIDFEDIINLKTKYQINLYLYAITLLRGKKGKVVISKEKIRDILCKDSTIDDYNFIHRFIKKPSVEITKNSNVKLNILASRKNNNIEMEVYK